MENFRKTTRMVRGLSLAMTISLFVSSCDFLSQADSNGRLEIHFAQGQYFTKAGIEIPDSSQFILKVIRSGGKTVYDGSFGDMPQQLVVSPGTYDISVRSGNFDKPEFSAPQFGDDQCVVVPEGGLKEVNLVCSQVNSGVRLNVDPKFPAAFPQGVLFLKSTEGRIMYSVSEKRIAYFKPGEVSLLVDNAGEQLDLLTRRLEPKEILTVGISAPAPDAMSEGIGSIRVSIDTTRIWTGTDIVIGGGEKGSDSDNAMDVTTARNSPGQKDVWVYGYIVGSFKSSGHITFDAPFPTSTNLAISGRTSTTENSSCISVELKKGEIRDVLNLVDHPENRGKKLFVKGETVDAYYGIPGIKNITEWKLK